MKFEFLPFGGSSDTSGFWKCSFVKLCRLRSWVTNNANLYHSWSLLQMHGCRYYNFVLWHDFHACACCVLTLSKKWKFLSLKWDLHGFSEASPWNIITKRVAAHSYKLHLFWIVFFFLVQIVECRRVLKWTYAYGYYLPENEHTKRQFFEYSQG